MRNYHRSIIGILLLTSFCFYRSSAQPKATPNENSSQRALNLAQAGHCSEAIPLLKRSISQSTDKDYRHIAGLAGLRCAMLKGQFEAAENFIRVLHHEFPNDPEVLYAAVHTYSDLATRASQELALRAPNSAQAHELNAESLEMQGKWEQAAKEYQKVLQQDPRLPGTHFKIGRLLLSEPNAPPDAAERAKKEFQQELEIDPSNAGAEYVLGELARQAQQWDDAVLHFARAAKLDSTFGDAFLGWGMALVSTKKFSEAVAPLEAAVKLEPQNPAAHYNLAIAYTRTGRKQDGDREFAINRSIVQNQPADQPQTQSAPRPQ
jgi:tetratricopeptide (TPR) repeat protein